MTVKVSAPTDWRSIYEAGSRLAKDTMRCMEAAHQGADGPVAEILDGMETEARELLSRIRAARATFRRSSPVPS